MNSSVANLFLVPIGIGSAILFGLSSYAQDGSFLPFSNNISYDLYIRYFLMFSLFYFVADFILMVVRYRPKNNIYFVHHSVCILSIIMSVFYFKSFIKYVLAFLTYELSTPLLHLSIQNRKKNLYNSYSRLVDVLFVVTYTIFRIGLGTVLSVKIIPLILRLDFPFNLLVVLPFVLQLMIYYWYYRILDVLFKK